MKKSFIHQANKKIDRMKNTLDIFWSKVEKTESCWLWLGYKINSGYGKFVYKGENMLSHRLSYQLHKGKIPQGLEIDHLCRVKHCVNPDHLEAVTRKENQIRGMGFISIESKKTHCPQGHPYSGDNLFIDYKGGRRCRKCSRVQADAYYWRTKNAR